MPSIALFHDPCDRFCCVYDLEEKPKVLEREGCKQNESPLFAVETCYKQSERNKRSLYFLSPFSKLMILCSASHGAWRGTEESR